MYSHNFGLTQEPFSIAPDPRFLFMSERHREALAHLLYGVDSAGSGSGGGFVLLTGDIGTGKTTICRCFLEQIPAGCKVAYIFNPKLSVTELLQSICDEFHISVAQLGTESPSVKTYSDALNVFLLQRHASGDSCVLIIDEAQNLAADVLEQLRLLTNLETSQRKLLQIVLIGQPELRTMLARPELEQLAQRVIARFHLGALSAGESTDYIRHRLAIAGHTGPLPFDAKALQRIHALTRGVPRRINLLCGRALLGAWANGLQQVDRLVVNQAAAEVFGSEPPLTRGNTRRALQVAGGLALVAATALTTVLIWSGLQKTPAIHPAATAATSANATAAAPSQRLTPAAPHAVEDVPPLLAQLPHDLNAAWLTLGTVWPLPDATGDACEAAALQQLQCYRTSHLTLPQLRQLARPGLLTLQADKATPVYALLVGLTEQTATLQIGSQQHTVRLASLGRLWRGDFATFWQPPQGYLPDLRDDSTGPAIDTLARQLRQIEGLPEPTTVAPTRLDAALRERVWAFQRTQGLTADGQPGPMTFMQLESATATTSPRLQTTDPRQSGTP